MFSSLLCTSHIEWLSLGRSPGPPDDAARCSIFQENIKFHQIFPFLSSGTPPASGEVLSPDRIQDLLPTTLAWPVSSHVPQSPGLRLCF